MIKEYCDYCHAEFKEKHPRYVLNLRKEARVYVIRTYTPKTICEDCKRKIEGCLK